MVANWIANRIANIYFMYMYIIKCVLSKISNWDWTHWDWIQADWIGYNYDWNWDRIHLPWEECIQWPLAILFNTCYMYWYMFSLKPSLDYTKRNLFQILLNQTEIRLYLPCTDWFGIANVQCDSVRLLLQIDHWKW